MRSLNRGLTLIYVVFKSFEYYLKDLLNFKNSSPSDILSTAIILNIIGECDIKHIMKSPIKTIMSAYKVSAYIFTTSLLVLILAIIYVSTSYLPIFSLSLYIYIIYKYKRLK